MKWNKTKKIVFFVVLFFITVSAFSLYFIISSSLSSTDKKDEVKSSSYSGSNSNLGGESETESYFKHKILPAGTVLVTSYLTWLEFSNKITESDELLIEEFSSYFKETDTKFNGLFIEFKPFKSSTFNTEKVEFRLIKTPFSEGEERGNHKNFNEHFKKFCTDGVQKVICFKNLKKTSDLIVPCPDNNPNTKMKHLKLFMNTASLEYRTLFLKKIMEHLQEKIKEYEASSSPGNDSVFYLSTEGHSVPWLHFRFDPEPKYFKTSEYRKLFS